MRTVKSVTDRKVGLRSAKSYTSGAAGLRVPYAVTSGLDSAALTHPLALTTAYKLDDDTIITIAAFFTLSNALALRVLIFDFDSCSTAVAQARLFRKKQNREYYCYQTSWAHCHEVHFEPQYHKYSDAANTISRLIAVRHSLNFSDSSKLPIA